jgi:hypothetical protein
MGSLAIELSGNKKSTKKQTNRKLWYLEITSIDRGTITSKKALKMVLFRPTCFLSLILYDNDWEVFLALTNFDLLLLKIIMAYPLLTSNMKGKDHGS